jgi:hypothetical protein
MMDVCMRGTALAAVALGIACRSASPAPVEATAAPTPVAVVRRPCMLPGDSIAGIDWTVGDVHAVDTTGASATGPAVVRLPATFHPATPRFPDRHRWAAADSSTLEIWTAADPIHVVGGSGVARFQRDVPCTIRVGDRLDGLVIRYWKIMRGQTDTVYDAAASAVLAPDLAVNAIITARTRAAREDLLRVMAEMQVPIPTPAAGPARRGT